jgi:hypothetical protein
MGGSLGVNNENIPYDGVNVSGFPPRQKRWSLGSGRNQKPLTLLTSLTGSSLSSWVKKCNKPLRHMHKPPRSAYAREKGRLAGLAGFTF